MWSKLSIKIKIFLGFGFIACFAVAGTGYISLESLSAYNEKLHKDVEVSTRILESVVQTGMKVLEVGAITTAADTQVRKLVELFSEVSDDQEREDAQMALQEILQERKEIMGEYHQGLYVFDLNKAMVATSNRDEVYSNEEDQDEEYMNIAWQLSPGEVHVGVIQRGDHESHDAIYSFPIVTPIMNDGNTERIGMLVDYIDARYLTNLVSGSEVGMPAINASTGTSFEFVTFFVDQSGTVLSGNSAEVHVSSEQEEGAIFEDVCHVAQSVPGSYVSFSEGYTIAGATCFLNGWTLVMEVEGKGIQSLWKETRDRIILLGLVILFVSILISLYPIRAITKPIKKLQIGSEKISRGEYATRVQVHSEDEYKDLADAFNEMAEKVEQLDRAKSDFISLASHQLRTPLASLKWYGTLLAEGEAGELQEGQKKFIHRMNISIRRMVGLVDDLLNASRIESGRLMAQPAEEDLIKLIHAVVLDLTPIAEDNGITIHFAPTQKAVLLHVDGSLLREVLHVLLENAIKYNHEGGEVDITFVEHPELFSVEIKDTGVGIPKEDQKSIFEKFTRGSNAKEMGVEGSGLGLFVAKEIMSTIGGEIDFIAKEGEGSTFSIHLKK